MNNYKVIAFDADDTLWINEPYFRAAEQEFAKLLSAYETENKIHQELYKVITGNIPTYGYGVKSCILSMIECAHQLSNGTLRPIVNQKIVNIGKQMLAQPVELIDGIEEVLKTLSKTHKLIVLTKGDLLDQEKKLDRSGLLSYFHHVEVMSEKNPKEYLRVLKHLDIDAKDFLMIGNSLKSDILPVVEIGGDAIHIPFHSIWQFETVNDNDLVAYKYKTLKNATELISTFK